MSISDKGTIDATGITKDTKGLVLMISDHLDWRDEYQHLMLLQDKLNNYIVFWEEKQYKRTYPGRIFTYCMIEIEFKYNPTKQCIKFLKTAQNQLSSTGIKIKYNISK